MPQNNQKIAEIFYRIADILESQGINWRPQAYRKAARNIELLNHDVKEIYKTGGHKALEDINGVGEALGNKIIEYLKTGKIEKYEKLKKESPYDIEGLSSLSTIGPKRALELYKKLGIRNINDLKEAANKGKIRKLPGFGVKSEQDIFDSIKLREITKKERVPLSFALKQAKIIKKKLSKFSEKIEIAGSIRRKKDTIGDIDILATSKDSKKLIDYFCGLKDVERVLSKGPTKVMVILKSGLQTDLRLIKKADFGAALLYFTGSKEHNIWLRKIAIVRGYKLNEYGLFNRKTSNKIASKTEEEIYKRLGLEYIPPEKRESIS